MRRPDSYFIASVDFPTDIDALYNLHKLAPGHVYIHLGGKTPEEKGVGRSLMHSKLFLAESVDRNCLLWVGSHNLTARAIEGGNYEAGIEYSGRSSEDVIQDAGKHLEACRATAKLFNPAEMNRYKEIQNRRRGKSDWEDYPYILVIHAEAMQFPTRGPFIVHILIGDTDFDSYFQTDRVVRLFLHKPGTLKPGKEVDITKASLWNGVITAVVRTELHPKNRGARAQFDAANYEIALPDLKSVPVFLEAKKSMVTTKTQTVLRIDGPGQLGAEVYSIAQESPIKNMLEGASPLDLHDIDQDMLRFFTVDSRRGKMLLYRPVIGVRQELNLVGYQETLHSNLPGQFATELMKDADERLHFKSRTPTNPTDPFFFLSKHTVRPKKKE